MDRLLLLEIAVAKTALQYNEACCKSVEEREIAKELFAMNVNDFLNEFNSRIIAAEKDKVEQRYLKLMMDEKMNILHDIIRDGHRLRYMKEETSRLEEEIERIKKIDAEFGEDAQDSSGQN